MLKNYIKIAWRNIWKNKLFSVINIISLAIGLSASFVIGLMVYYDFTFDKFHKDGDRIYRITTQFISPEETEHFGGVNAVLADALRENVSGLESVSSFFRYEPLKVETDARNKVFKKPDNVIFADSSYFNVISYKWLAGNKASVLQMPNEVVLTQQRAKDYFPNISVENIIGKTLIYNDSIPTKITGIVADFQQRTDFVFQEFISLPTALQLIADAEFSVTNTNWNSYNSNSQVIIKRQAAASAANIQKQVEKLCKSKMDQEDLANGEWTRFYLQPLDELHFDTRYSTFDYSAPQASKKVLINLGIVALFLLLLGCINFINLTTAQATQRAREIGIRKTLGSSKKQLILQFLGETFLLTIIASLLSFILSFWLLRAFSNFIPSGLSFQLFTSPIVIVFMLLLLIVVSLFSGIYPAFVLSGFKPVSILKNHSAAFVTNASFRKGLTVFQFVIAQIFIIGTLLVGKQVHYLMNKDMGVAVEDIAYLQLPWNDAAMSKKELFKTRLAAIPELTKISLGGPPPASLYLNSTIVDFEKEGEVIEILQEQRFGDADYFDLYNLKLLAGRKPLNDTIKEFVINETMLHKLGYNHPAEAVGQQITQGEYTYPIVGVMQDFNQKPLTSAINPGVFVGDISRDWRSQFNTIHFKFQPKTEDVSRTIAKVKTIWGSIYPESDFEIQFMDETVANFYKSQQRTQTLLNWATGLAILISVLGLFALVIYTTERRVKEIGIRKILGASLLELQVLLCKDFLKLISLAIIIAIPIAYWRTSVWLNDFVYRTSLSWWVFAASGIAMLLLSLLIISFKTISTSRQNPVKAIRTE
ncbi:ABC transporter permease [Zunongwangia sp. HRR-M8]|uniref:ABC transporter permease n=1 Tax=Zunongwangia sp. HRR-M8 TaxID=3015170 RepID=UPI0022DE66C3|nr:FtsX-like permease family protein [Zunongwangia sp. HRR-M8]WBL22291.1 ABC transporter permease [Zunongwangia sp. HRR-M8]